MEQNGLLEVQNLTKAFRVPSRRLFEKDRSLLAVNDVSLSICRGETLGVVGESGCGKSTLGRTMIKLIRPTRGRILLEGKDITALSEKEMRPYRRELQIIFQDPYASLNPRMTIGEAIADPLIIQGLYSDRAVRTAYVQALMEECGLDPAMAHRYPHEFSGGQRQRIGIARALGLSPKLIVCDEPVSALDVSIQSQILNLLTRLRVERELTLMFISHDLSVINYISDRVAVMYLGKVVELAEKKELFAHPAHPYTRALLAAVPQVGRGKFDLERTILEGTIPSPINLPEGCIFSSRCPMATAECKAYQTSLSEIAPGHYAACAKL